MSQNDLVQSAATALLLALALLPSLPGTPALAQGQETVAGDEAAEAVKGTIADQLAAFQADDGERALSHAAPSIRAAFPTADVFMSMVKSGYAPVYRPSQVTFGRLRSEAGQAVQEVYLTDTAGEEWLATYTLALQADGSWKITGCYLRRDPGSGA